MNAVTVNKVLLNLKPLWPPQWPALSDLEWAELPAGLDLKSGREFLQPEFIAKNATAGKIAPAAETVLQDLAAKIKADAALAFYFCFFYDLLFRRELLPRTAPTTFPDRLPMFTEAETWGFYALLVLAGFPVCAERFAARRLPPEVTAGAIADLTLWLEHFKRNKGIVGISSRILDWECGLLAGELYRIGRLQFALTPFHGQVHVYRHRRTRQLQALAAPEITFNAEGQYDGIDGRFAASGTWKSVLVGDDCRITGNPVATQGYAASRELTLGLNEWEEVLKPGDRIIDTHIPAGEPLTMTSAFDAMRQAMIFFEKYFPGHQAQAFSCISWLLDTQYEQMLDPASNILRFQHGLYLFPVSESGQDSYWRIFGEDGLKNGLEHTPQNNRMQQAVAAFLRSGGHLRSGGGFIMTETVAASV